MAKSPRRLARYRGFYNLAGFITTASGQRMAFVQYLSGYAVEPADQRNSPYSAGALLRAGFYKGYLPE